jgi:hypothetical protein
MFLRLSQPVKLAEVIADISVDGVSAAATFGINAAKR